MKSPLQEVLPYNDKIDLPFPSDLTSQPECVQYGYRLYYELVNQQKIAVTYLIENQDSYCSSDVCLKTFSQISSSFLDGYYKNVTEIVSDLRLIIENIYRANGFNHWLSKHARTLETVLEQKLALLPRQIRDLCSLESTNVLQNKEHLNQDINGSRRRSKPSKTLETPIMLQLRLEYDALDKEHKKFRDEQRKERDEERRSCNEKLLEQLLIFEEEIITMEMLEEIKFCWQLPCVGMLINMLHDFMGLQHFNYTEFELASFFMDKSVLISKIFTSLLLTAHERKSIKNITPHKYNEWNALLMSKVSKWFCIASQNGADYAAEKFGFDKSLFYIFGLENPIPFESSFLQLSLSQKLTLLKALCEVALENDDVMCNTLAEIPIIKRQDLCLGQDLGKNTYHFFPQFNSTDIRVYKQHFTKGKTTQNGLTYELVAWNLDTLGAIVSSFESSNDRKTSCVYNLQQTLQALYDELLTRKEDFTKSQMSGKLSVMQNFYWPDGETDVSAIPVHR